MIPRLAELKQYILNKKHHSFRRDADLTFSDADLKISQPDLVWADNFVKACAAEEPVILPGENLVFTRSKRPFRNWPNRCPDKHFGFTAANICADWEQSLAQGLLGRRTAAEAALRDGRGNREAMQSSIQTIDAVLALAARYAAAARKQGRGDLAGMLEQVPAHAPQSFRQALQSLKFMHSCVWFCANHVGLGRFDQYMLPYYQRDLDHGVITREQAAELIAEFFISLNKDIDLYPGVQPGDNGQSLMLGGVTRDGKTAVNALTWLVLEVSEEVNMIDPKINLRVDRNTDPKLLELAAKLTRRGLGFPQYCNDEVVIPALVKHRYTLEDARDYTVAACWEFIIPGRGMDVPNINALSFPFAVDAAIREKIGRGTFADLETVVQQKIKDQVDGYVENKRRWFDDFPPSPYYSVLMTSCLERGLDINHGGCDYYNYGIHGAGSANAADALAAVKKFVYEDKTVKSGELLDALWKNWADHEELRQKMLHCELKTGNHQPEADAMLKKLFDWFSDACEAIKDNGRGGMVRPGTGTAMYYVWLRDPDFCGEEPTVGATADGRKVGDFFGSSLSPAPGAKLSGPISMMQSFGQLDYSRVCNGGPITMELSDTVFRDDEALAKVAMLVRTFVHTGCQQLQMNVLNPAILKDAQIHPDKHRDLIVRVWGWSGYFVELAPEYQQQIINRHLYAA